jgi:hypothetical protein
LPISSTAYKSSDATAGLDITFENEPIAAESPMKIRLTSSCAVFFLLLAVCKSADQDISQWKKLSVSEGDFKITMPPDQAARI